MRKSNKQWYKVGLATGGNVDRKEHKNLAEWNLYSKDWRTSTFQQVQETCTSIEFSDHLCLYLVHVSPV